MYPYIHTRTYIQTLSKFQEFFTHTTNSENIKVRRKREREREREREKGEFYSELSSGLTSIN